MKKWSSSRLRKSGLLNKNRGRDPGRDVYKESKGGDQTHLDRENSLSVEGYNSGDYD